MSEPLSGGGAVAVTIGGASVFGLLTNTDFGVVVGAFAGALFVVTQQKEIPVWRMAIHLLVAFVVGVLGAGVAASLMQWLTLQRQAARCIVCGRCLGVIHQDTDLSLSTGNFIAVRPVFQTARRRGWKWKVALPVS